MSSFKKLNKADVTSVSYAANKQWSLVYDYLGTSGAPNDEYISYYIGKNESFNITGSITNSQYWSLVYDQINHLFYQLYTSSLNTGSLMFNINTYESASQQRPTASYFNYNTNPLLVKQFPTGSGNQIGVINVNQNIYGSKILPNSFQISCSQHAFLIKDDGNGNLIDLANSSSYIGNIFYAHGAIIITNKNYIGQFFDNDLQIISFQNEHIVYENEVRCIVKESDFNLSYNPTLLKYRAQTIVPISGSASNGYTTTGSFDNSTVKDFATGSSFQPYVTTIGLYNDDNDLLMVAKLAKPIAISSDTDMTFIVKYDT